jgi:hypothetical protein
MADQMQSWTDGQTRTQILEFVRSVTEPGASFVPARDRIAAFDNDGTLWCEKPMCPQADFLLRRWKDMAQAHPGLARKQPWKAVIEGDQKWLAGILDHVPELTRGVTEGYEGITAEAFERAVRTFFDTARHPALGVPYTRLGYRPMRELIDPEQARPQITPGRRRLRTDHRRTRPARSRPPPPGRVSCAGTFPDLTPR